MKRQLKKAREPGKMTRFFTLIFLIGLLLTGYLGYYLSQPLPLASTPLEFSLRPGSSVKSSARQLQQAGVIEQADVFAWLVRLSGKSAQIKAGQYTLTQAATPWQLLDMLVNQGQHRNSFTRNNLPKRADFIRENSRQVMIALHHIQESQS